MAMSRPYTSSCSTSVALPPPCVPCKLGDFDCRPNHAPAWKLDLGDAGKTGEPLGSHSARGVLAGPSTARCTLPSPSRPPLPFPLPLPPPFTPSLPSPPSPPPSFTVQASLEIDFFFFLSGLLAPYTLLRRMRKSGCNDFDINLTTYVRSLPPTPSPQPTHHSRRRTAPLPTVPGNVENLITHPPTHPSTHPSIPGLDAPTHPSRASMHRPAAA